MLRKTNTEAEMELQLHNYVSVDIVVNDRIKYCWYPQYHSIGVPELGFATNEKENLCFEILTDTRQLFILKQYLCMRCC